MLHIQLAERNMGLLIAPLDANTLAKLAHGAADNLLLCTARAWMWRMDHAFKATLTNVHGSQATHRPVVLAPAMNTYMWHQSPTQSALDTLRRAGARVIDPVVKTLACGVRGAGALADPEAIVSAFAADVDAWREAQEAAEARGLPPLARTG